MIKIEEKEEKGQIQAGKLTGTAPRRWAEFTLGERTSSKKDTLLVYQNAQIDYESPNNGRLKGARRRTRWNVVGSCFRQEIVSKRAQRFAS